MDHQQLLQFFAKHDSFDRANRCLCNPQLRHFAQPWLAVELSQSLMQLPEAQGVNFSEKYQLDDQFLRCLPKTYQVEACEKRYASSADLALITPDRTIWFEVKMVHQDHLESNREIQRLQDDFERVDAFNRYLTQHRATLLLGIWGSFNNQQMKVFSQFDNQSRCSYVLDSRATGSSQISRLCQLQREGEPRFFLAIY